MYRGICSRYGKLYFYVHITTFQEYAAHVEHQFTRLGHRSGLVPRSPWLYLLFCIPTEYAHMLSLLCFYFIIHLQINFPDELLGQVFEIEEIALLFSQNIWKKNLKCTDMIDKSWQNKTQHIFFLIRAAYDAQERNEKYDAFCLFSKLSELVKSEVKIDVL